MSANMLCKYAYAKMLCTLPNCISVVLEWLVSLVDKPQTSCGHKNFNQFVGIVGVLKNNKLNGK